MVKLLLRESQVTKIDDLFGRKSKSSKGMALATLKNRYEKQINRTPTRHTAASRTSD